MSKFTTGLEEYEVLDQRTIEYLREILRNVHFTEERIEDKLNYLQDPANVHQVTLLLERVVEHSDIDVAKAVYDLTKYAKRYIRVTKRIEKKYAKMLQQRLFEERKKSKNSDLTKEELAEIEKDIVEQKEAELSKFGPALAQYQSKLSELFQRAGLMNKTALLMSFAARLQKTFYKADKQAEREKTDII